jgi:hypothetical protein
MRVPDDGDDLPYAQLSLSQVEVDVDGLTDFRTFLGRELDANLRPGAAGIANDHSLGVRFGADNQGVLVGAARERYFQSLAAATANLAAYIEAAEIIIEAVRRVSTAYGEADLSAAATSDRLHHELNQAFIAVRTAHNDAQQRELLQETQRELNRLRPGTP